MSSRDFGSDDDWIPETNVVAGKEKGLAIGLADESDDDWVPEAALEEDTEMFSREMSDLEKETNVPFVIDSKDRSNFFFQPASLRAVSREGGTPTAPSSRIFMPSPFLKRDVDKQAQATGDAEKTTIATDDTAQVPGSEMIKGGGESTASDLISVAADVAADVATHFKPTQPSDAALIKVESITDCEVTTKASLTKGQSSDLVLRKKDRQILGATTGRPQSREMEHGFVRRRSSRILGSRTPPQNSLPNVQTILSTTGKGESTLTSAIASTPPVLGNGSTVKKLSAADVDDDLSDLSTSSPQHAKHVETSTVRQCPSFASDSGSPSSSAFKAYLSLRQTHRVDPDELLLPEVIDPPASASAAQLSIRHRSPVEKDGVVSPKRKVRGLLRKQSSKPDVSAPEEQEQSTRGLGKFLAPKEKASGRPRLFVSSPFRKANGKAKGAA